MKPCVSCRKLISASERDIIMKTNIFKWCAFAFVLLSIGVMIFPSAYVMRWMSPPGSNEIWTSSYSYFSFIPYGYGNFFPFLTVITAVFSAVFRFITNVSLKLNITALVLTCISAGCSLLSLLMSDSITLAGVIIFIFMVSSIVFQCLYLRTKQAHSPA